MAAPALSVAAVHKHLSISPVASFPNTRALAWQRDLLYASRGYTLLAARLSEGQIKWSTVAHYRPEWWRQLTSRSALSFRLVRDGFHALAITPQGNLVAAVSGAMATLRRGETEFRITHRLQRGSRPLHIASTPAGQVFWGEYFDNPNRDAVHIYASQDGGLTWDIAYTFAAGSIRHVHNVIYDDWQHCLWIFTGDYGHECRILRASLDFRSVEELLSGNQQTRAVAALIAESGIYFASDTPLEQNHIYFLARSGRIQRLTPIPSSSIYACTNRNGMFFSTMVEPSLFNRSRVVALFGSSNSENWNLLTEWEKDRWPMKFFQYGNAFLPDGHNHTDLLAVTTIAVNNADMQTTIWRTSTV
ncbi:MAG TPA: hypothetical protein VGU90_11620 [Terriglobales bacterium]|nr:hypothetical protein [Terriglobales bacterium]